MAYRLVLALGLLSLGSYAQGVDQGQSRLIFHEVKEISSHWSLDGLLIGNVMPDQQSNLNLLGGVGYRKKLWWVEAMLQYQRHQRGGQWFADFRAFAKPRPKWGIYMEAAQFLNKNTWYTTAFVERTLGKGFGLGLETENVNGSEMGVLAAGPRFSKSLPVIGKFQPELAVAWYAASNQPKVLRLYVVVHRRDKR